MKRIKNKIAALVCGIGLLCVVNSPIFAQTCIDVSYSCCGGTYGGSYDFIDDTRSAFIEFATDYLANCGCEF
jgi:hypothetical protein